VFGFKDHRCILNCSKNSKDPPLKETLPKPTSEAVSPAISPYQPPNSSLSPPPERSKNPYIRRRAAAKIDKAPPLFPWKRNQALHSEIQERAVLTGDNGDTPQFNFPKRKATGITQEKTKPKERHSVEPTSSKTLTLHKIDLPSNTATNQESSATTEKKEPSNVINAAPPEKPKP